MIEPEDYYAVLGVTATSDDVVIKGAYKALMLKYHPDTNPSADATRRAAAINTAYQVLGDPVRRAAYDELRARATAAKASRSAPPPPPPPPPPPRHQARPASPPPAPPPQPAPPRGARLMGLAFTLLCLLAGLSVLSNAPTVPAATNETTTAEDLEGAEMVSGNMTDMMTVPGDATSNMTDGFADETASYEAEMPADPMDKLTSAPALDYAVIEKAARDVDGAVRQGGIPAARAKSQTCHDAVAEMPTWSGADGCAAFDFAARLIDENVARDNKTPESAYFKFREDNLGDLYQASNLGSYFAWERLQRIRKAAHAAANQIFAEEVARRQKAETVTTQDSLEEDPSSATGNYM